MNKLSALSKNTSGLNSGAETIAKLVRLDDIKLHPVFQKLFPINPAIKAQIIDRMNKYGYDKSQPLIVWKEEKVLLDGHTRREAAYESGITTVPVVETSFKSTDDALEYVYGLQLGRRNLSDAEILTAMAAFDQLKNRGRITAADANPSEKGKSAEHTAKVLGISVSKVERARAIEKKASDETKAAVKSGEISINQAYNTIKDHNQKPDKKIEIPENQYYLSDEEYGEIEKFIEAYQSENELVKSALSKLLNGEKNRRNKV